MEPPDTELRLLHVDDDPEFADLTATYLERAYDRFDVDVATSASDGLERLSDADFDCVVSDYEMPGRDGIDFLETVREEWPDLPFILYTGRGSEEVASAAISAGATDYLQKGSGTGQYELLANRIRNAVEQYRATRRATKLDRVRTLASDITQTLVHAGAREEAENRICESISDSEPYMFAWIGEVDPETDQIEPRTWAGVEDGYLEEITVTADESPTGQGPGGRAARERRVAISQNLREDSDFERWQDTALERGYRAVAAVPLEHDETLYGVLGVYASRPNAFEEEERELLEDVGEDIGKAFHSFELQAELRRKTQAMDEAPVGITITGPADEDNPLIYVNDRFEELTGYAADEIVGRNCRFLQGEGTDTRPVAAMQAAVENREPAQVELRNYRKEGTEFWNRVSIAPVEDGARTVTNWVGFQEDVTERKEREQAIAHLHETAQTLVRAGTEEEVADITVEAARDVLGLPASAVHLYDEAAGALSPVAVTERIEDLVGTPPTFSPGDSLAWEAFDAGEAKVYDDVSNVPGRWNPDTPIRSEVILPVGDHGVFICGSTESGEFDDHDVSLARTLAAHATTVLDRLEREQDLQRERERYRTLVDNFPAGGVFLYDTELRCILAGGEGLSEVGLTPTDIEGESPRDRYPAAIAGELETHLARALEGHRTQFEQTYQGRHYRIQTVPIGDEPVRQAMAVSQDITGRKQREQQAELMDDVVQEMRDGAVIVQDGVVEYTNPRVSELVGYPESELDGMPMEAFISPEYRETVRRRHEARLRGDDDDIPEMYEIEVRSKTGDSIPVEINVCRIEYDGEPATLSLVRDISERRRREQELARKNERLDRFASVVSHDLKNPLEVAHGRLRLASEECESEHLASATDAVERSQELIDDLLQLAREGEDLGDTEPVRLTDIVEACWRRVETGEAALVTDTTGEIRADPSRFQQLLENLLRNAVEYGGENVTITVGSMEAGFYVEDDGPGIPEDERDRIFELGHSVRGEGTGFGLAIVKQVVDAHGWEISVAESEAGGVRFEITGVETV